ncbi:MAG TPA: extensin family protein [Kofleriaceae bacterium]|nr:extensin family protein [Kofleriaceae bacterium]
MARGAFVAGALASLAILCAAPGIAAASPASCPATLSDLGVSFRRVKHRGVKVAVAIRGDLGGVTYRPYRKGPMVMSCALAVALARIGPALTSLGIERAIYSTLIKRKNVRGSHHRSKHSFGRAIDVHEFEGQKIGRLRVKDDYEQGLGTADDCAGKPLTVRGALLRNVYCIADGSGGFSLILTPDDNAHHYNHFHLEVEPWPAPITGGGPRDARR